MQDLVQTVLSGLAMLDIDMSPATLVKYGFLLVAVILLLWILGDVYRGEIQNQDMPVEVVSHSGESNGKNEALFTKRTLDTRSERLPAKIIVEHRFVITHGDKVFSRKVRVLRESFKLCMQQRQSPYLRNGQFAFHHEIEKALKNKAEVLVRQSLREYRKSLPQYLGRALKSKSWTEPTASGATYLVRVHFPSNPFFLLFRHPDREVKATGWLTLLTSLFALFAQFLFTSPESLRSKEPIRSGPLRAEQKAGAATETGRASATLTSKPVDQ